MKYFVKIRWVLLLHRTLLTGQLQLFNLMSSMKKKIFILQLLLLLAFDLSIVIYVIHKIIY
jgi:hypothetical protein